MIRVKLGGGRADRGGLRDRLARRRSFLGPARGPAVAPDGALFLSDDGLGAVYRITYRGS